MTAKGRDDHRKVMIMARLDPEIWSEVKRLSKLKRRSAASTLRDLVRAGLAAKGELAA